MHTTIKKGSRGEDVKTLQRFLGVTADGIFGAATEAALVEWQATHTTATGARIGADGICGPVTWAAIEYAQKHPATTTAQAIASATTPQITQLPISVHISNCSYRTPKYLVIHYTAGSTSKAGTARSTRNVFISRQASADFIVDDAEIVQINPDINRKYTWAVGDGNGKYGVTNANSISIEMCSTLRKGASASAANHDGWSFTEAVMQRTVQLARYLMRKYNIPADRVIRHYDASRKSCPGIVGWNDNTIYDATTGKATAKKNHSNEWLKFHKRICEK